MATIDYANWMGNLPTEIANQPINWLAIPGSHDTFSYSISKNSDIAPDDANLLFFNKIPCVKTIAKKIVYRWSVTENGTCTEQLNTGIRYMDLRLAPNPDDQEVCLIHGLYGMAVKEALTEILNFLMEHPKEIVFLDFQHFYGFTNDTHENLIRDIKNAFQLLLCPFTTKPESISLSWLWKNGYRVFVFYRNQNCYLHDDLWPSEYLPNPWPNTVSVQQLIAFLTTNYQRGRPRNKFYVTQGVLTPDSCYVCMHLTATLKSMLAEQASSAMRNWLHDKRTGPQGINFVMFDFANENPFLLKQVINKNYNFLQSLKQQSVDESHEVTIVQE